MLIYIKYRTRSFERTPIGRRSEADPTPIERRPEEKYVSLRLIREERNPRYRIRELKYGRRARQRAGRARKIFFAFFSFFSIF